MLLHFVIDLNSGVSNQTSTIFWCKITWYRRNSLYKLYTKVKENAIQTILNTGSHVTMTHGLC